MKDESDLSTPGKVQRYLMNEIGFCGCGVSDAPIDLLRDVLRIYAMTDVDRPDSYKERSDALDERFHKDDGLAYFFHYWADDKGLTEHGGSVPGWLSGDGWALLAALERWTTDEIEEAQWPQDGGASHGAGPMSEPHIHRCTDCPATAIGTALRMPSQWSQSRCPKCHVKRKRGPLVQR